jgi:SHS2 domain-containing protein
MLKQKFRFLEHTADVYIEAYGSSLEEAFENAALATFDVMTDTDKVEAEVKDKVLLKAQDKEALLYDWIEELLFLFDIKTHLYSKFKVKRIDETEVGFILEAAIWGEIFNAKKHPQKLGVKAITYHRMEICEEDNQYIVKFVLDV